ncbi:MAG: dipeptidase PepE, partial [Chitinophagales bacterium]
MHLLLASTSTIYGQPYLEYLKNDLLAFLGEKRKILFIPFARPSGISWERYTLKVRTALETIGIEITGIHESADMVQALEKSEAIFTGGGNTFVLLNELYNQSILETLRDCIEKGTPYIGTSAGPYIAGRTIGTTNDMPIVYPAS